MNKSKNKKWILWVLLIFLPPIGIVYMWVTEKDFTQKTKIILSVVFSLWFIIALASGKNNNTTNQQSVANKVSTKEQSTSSIKDKTTSAAKENQSTITKTENVTEIQETTSTEEATTESEPSINEENNENNSNNNAEANENNNEETEPYIAATTSANLFTYVLNTSTKKFHVPSCSDVKKIKNTNYSEYTGTYDEVTSMGYVACKRCHPR